MKSWLYILILTVFWILLFEFLHLPFWVFILIVIPVGLYLIIYSSIKRNFRPEIQPLPIPKGYESRIRTLNEDADYVTDLGFEKFDEFYLALLPDVVVYAFLHKTKRTYLAVYHLGTKKSCDYVTFFQKGYGLTTCSTIEGGSMPRPPEAMLQTFPLFTYDELLEAHLKSTDFLLSKHLDLMIVDKSDFHKVFMESFFKSGQYIMSYPFWPLRALIWTITSVGKKHLATIEQQYQQGMLPFLDNPQ